MNHETNFIQETCDPEEAEVDIPGGSYHTSRDKVTSYVIGDVVDYTCDKNLTI